MRIGLKPATQLSGRGRRDITCSVRSQDGSAQQKREAKDPKKFSSMDQARNHLELSEPTRPPGLIFKALQFVRDTSIGGNKQEQPWWSLGAFFQNWTRPSRWQLSSTTRMDTMPEGLQQELDGKTEHLEQLSNLLLLDSDQTSIRRFVCAFPHVLQMDVAEVAVRLVVLKDVLPNCDACYLIERYPRLFLSGDASVMRERVSGSYRKLCHSLKGASCSRIIEDDPELLFMDKLDHGLGQLKALWPTADEQCFANSEPHELACAVRALCNSRA